MDKNTTDDIKSRSKTAEQRFQQKANDAILQLTGNKLGDYYSGPNDIINSDEPNPQESNLAAALAQMIAQNEARYEQLKQLDPVEDEEEHNQIVEKIKNTITEGKALIDEVANNHPQLTQDDVRQLKNILQRKIIKEI